MNYLKFNTKINKFAVKLKNANRREQVKDILIKIARYEYIRMDYDQNKHTILMHLVQNKYCDEILIKQFIENLNLNKEELAQYINYQDDENGNSSLHWLFDNLEMGLEEKERCIRLMISYGADLNLINKKEVSSNTILENNFSPVFYGEIIELYEEIKKLLAEIKNSRLSSKNEILFTLTFLNNIDDNALLHTLNYLDNQRIQIKESLPKPSTEMVQKIDQLVKYLLLEFYLNKETFPETAKQYQDHIFGPLDNDALKDISLEELEVLERLFVYGCDSRMCLNGKAAEVCNRLIQNANRENRLTYFEIFSFFNALSSQADSDHLDFESLANYFRFLAEGKNGVNNKSHLCTLWDKLEYFERVHFLKLAYSTSTKVINRLTSKDLRRIGYQHRSALYDSIELIWTSLSKSTDFIKVNDQCVELSNKFFESQGKFQKLLTIKQVKQLRKRLIYDTKLLLQENKECYSQFLEENKSNSLTEFCKKLDTRLNQTNIFPDIDIITHIITHIILELNEFRLAEELLNIIKEEQRTTTTYNSVLEIFVRHKEPTVTQPSNIFKSAKDRIDATTCSLMLTIIKKNRPLQIDWALEVFEKSKLLKEGVNVDICNTLLEIIKTSNKSNIDMALNVYALATLENKYNFTTCNTMLKIIEKSPTSNIALAQDVFEQALLFEEKTEVDIYITMFEIISKNEKSVVELAEKILNKAISAPVTDLFRIYCALFEAFAAQFPKNIHKNIPINHPALIQAYQLLEGISEEMLNIHNVMNLQDKKYCYGIVYFWMRKQSMALIDIKEFQITINNKSIIKNAIMNALEAEQVLGKWSFIKTKQTWTLTPQKYKPLQKNKNEDQFSKNNLSPMEIKDLPQPQVIYQGTENASQRIEEIIIKLEKTNRLKIKANTDISKNFLGDYKEKNIIEFCEKLDIQLIQNGRFPDENIISHLISQSNDSDFAMRLLNLIKKPSPTTYNNILQFFAHIEKIKERDIEFAYTIFEKAKATHQNRISMEAHIAMLTIFANSKEPKNVERAFKVFIDSKDVYKKKFKTYQWKVAIEDNKEGEILQQAIEDALNTEGIKEHCYFKKEENPREYSIRPCYTIPGQSNMVISSKNNSNSNTNKSLLFFPPNSNQKNLNTNNENLNDTKKTNGF